MATVKPLTCEKQKLRQPEWRAVPLTGLLGMRMTFGPNPKNPPHRRAAQRGNRNTARLTTPACNQPETAATTGKKTARPVMTKCLQPHKAGNNKHNNPTRPPESGRTNPIPTGRKRTAKKPTDNRPAKANRATCQKTQPNKPPAMKGTAKTYAGQTTFSGGKPPKPQLPQPAKPIRKRPCFQHAEFKDDA